MHPLLNKFNIKQYKIQIKFAIKKKEDSLQTENDICQLLHAKVLRPGINHKRFAEKSQEIQNETAQRKEGIRRHYSVLLVLRREVGLKHQKSKPSPKIGILLFR